MGMKRITSLLMALVLLVGVISICAPEVSAAGSSFKTSAECVALIKEYEGFCKYPIWDYGQYSVGYGTRCPDDMLEYYQTYGITEEEAETLLRNFLVSFEKDVNQGLIDKYQLTLNQNQFDALISFSYNCGSAWIYNSSSSVIRDAILSGATGNDLIRAFALWCSAGGEVLTYLLTRRLAEANMYLNGVYNRTPPAHYCYVLYEANGGTTSPRTQGYSTEWEVAPFPVPTYEGHTFDGWYTEPTGGTKVTSLTAEHKGKTLYAHWLDADGNVPDNSIDPVTITVTGSDVNIRKGPGTNYASIGKAQKGDQMVITETAEGTGYTWGKFDGGWICLQYTNFDEASKNPGGETTTPNEPGEEETPTEPPVTEPEEEKVILTGTVNVREFLRIRSGPGTNYDLVEYLGPGDRVEIYETKTVGAVIWGRISNGWISLDYVILDEKVEEPEEPSEPSEPEEPTEPTEPTEPEKPTEPTEPSEPEKPTEPTEPSEPENPTEPTEPSEPEKPATDVWTGQIVNCTKLRIRTGPGTNYDIAGYLDVNTVVTITEIRDGSTMKWGKIAEGWIGLDYVKILSTPQDAPEQEEPDEVLTGTVNVNEWLRIRVGPGTSYAIAGYLYPKDRVTITEVRNVNGTKWGKITEGWISLDYVILDEKDSGEAETPTEPTEPSEPAQPKVMTVIADCLNVRSAPGTSNSIVGYLYEGAKVEILEETMVGSTKWGRISNGWICMDYVV